MKFEKIVKNRVDKIEKILVEKGKEYAKENDRFHNFNEAARMEGSTPEKALWGMFLKHYVSVRDMVFQNRKFEIDQIDEKIGDAINYFILLEGLLKIKISEEKNEEKNK